MNLPAYTPGLTYTHTQSMRQASKGLASVRNVTAGQLEQGRRFSALNRQCPLSLSLHSGAAARESRGGTICR